MKLSLTSWNKTLKSLGYKVVRKANLKRKREQEMGQQNYEKLEPRQMLAGDTGLAVQADLTQLLATENDPLVAKLGQFDANPSYDLAILNASGSLTVATNGQDGTWQSRQTTDLGVGPLHGMELSLVDGDEFADLILQGRDSLFVALNDGNGNFSVSQTLTPFAAGEMAPGFGDSLDLEVGDFNGDFILDVATLAPGLNQLAVYFGVGDGTFSAALIESTGADVPTSLASGDFVGNGFPDIAVGHADGSVTLLENINGNDFTNRPDLSVTGFSSISDLDSADLDGDGDDDIVVASGDQITVLNNQQNPLENSPTITNGSFGQGLTGWNTEIVGHRSDELAGTVIAQSGFTQLVENESFLVSANQEFIVPENPETIEVDILSLGLEDPAGGIPDAFEISILDADGNSLVPTFRPDASSFFNVNPGNDVSLAPGVTFDGTTVSLDISALPAGTEATIYFDLIGNGPGNGSTVTFDNVRVTPDDDFDSVMTQTVLEGPFVNVDQIVIDDVDGDQRLDIAATETSGDKLLVFNGQADGTFDREEIDLSSLGGGFVSLDAAPLTAGDGVSDLVVLADGSNVAITPLVADAIAPTAELASPIADQTNTGDVSRIDIRFSEAIRDLGSDDSMSVTNADNYTVTFLGADGVEGTSDDQTLAIVGTSYVALTGIVSLNIDPASTPLEDGVYVVTLNSQNLKDRHDNLLADGAEVSFEFTMNQAGPVIAAIAPLVANEGSVVNLLASFTDAGGATPYTATVSWGDGSTTSLNMLDFADGVGTLAANHVYADNGDYDITLTIEDAGGVTTQSFTTATIANVAPVVVAGDDVTVVRNQAITFALGNFTDVGFDNVDTGSVESFTATIDWGDGVVGDGTVESISGTPGTPSTGSVSGSHTFTTAGTFVVTVTVTDDDGGVDSQQLTITVSDDVPNVAVPAAAVGNEGSQITVATTFEDLGSDGTYAATVNWGDGTSGVANVTFADGTGTISANHIYGDDGTYTVEFTLVDPDTNSVSVSTSAQVSNVAPTLVVASNQTVDIGELLNLTIGNFTDPGFDNASAGTSESFIVSIDWGDGTFGSPAVSVQQGSEGVLTSGSIDAAHAFSSPGTYTVAVTVTDDDGGSTTETLEVTVQDDVSQVGVWLPTIDFDTNANASGISAGDIVAEQFAAWGVHISTHDPVNNPAMIFDSANPTGGDYDLATTDQNNILIISEDADSSDPDDRAAGGTLIFDFDNPVMLDDVGLLDVDTNEVVTIRIYDADSNLISETLVNGAGDNTAQTVALSETLVSRMEIEFSASGAVTFVEFCRDNDHSIVSATGNDSVNEAESYDLSLNAVGVDITQWIVNWGDGSVQSTTDSNLSHVFADGADQVEIVVTGLAADGSVYRSLGKTVDILNVAPVLTIDGVAEVEAGIDYVLNLSSVDPGTDTISQWVIDWGDGTSETILGDPDQVTHQYANAGQYTVAAQAFDEDSTSAEAGSELGIIAKGSEGGEQFELSIDGVVVATYTVTSEFERYTYQADSQVAIGDVRIEFINDHWDPANGIDNNLIVDKVEIDSRAYETEADDVYSTGTWKPADGITPGFRNSQMLNSNGYFQFDAIEGTKLEVVARGSEGGEQFELQIDDVVVATFVVGTSNQTFTYSSAETIAASSVKIVFTNDLWDPANGIDRNLTVTQLRLDGNVYQTNSPDVFSTATWKAEDGVVPGFREAFSLHSNGYFQFDAAAGPTTLVPYLSNSISVVVTQPDSVWLPSINFERGADGLSLEPGEVITDQFAGLGIHVTTNDPANHPAMIFDSSQPTGGDSDLGSPSSAFGGPGQGNGGQSGDGVNDQSLNNILIISENNNPSNPDDNASGGTLIFTFDQAVMLDEISLLDIDAQEATIVLFDINGNQIQSTQVNGQGNNSFQTVALNALGVARMEVVFTGSGAITDIVFCRDEGHAIEAASTKFFIAEGSTDDVYRYTAGLEQIDGFAIDPTAISRGITTTSDGSTAWVVKSNEWVYVYDGNDNSYQGKWDAQGPEWARGIATDDTDVWIVDDNQNRVYFYADAAGWRSGSHQATSSFALDSRNANPGGIEVHGDILWVTDVGRDQVFVYDTSGSYLGKWHLDSANGRPSGIATDSSGQNLWVTDYDDGEVYYYAGAGDLRSGSLTATSIIALPANNSRPEGIADPTTPINIDDVVNGTIAAEGEVAEYSFDVAAGDRVFFEAISGTLFLGWSLTAPSGATVFDASLFTDRGVNQLLETGTYTLTVGQPSGTRTGDFSFRLWDVPETTVAAIDLDQPVEDQITSLGQQRQYTFNGLAGQTIFPDRQLGNIALTWNIVSPTGATIYSRSFLDSGPIELSEDGQYTLTVGSTSAAGASTLNPFAFTIVDVVPAPTLDIEFGQLVTTTIAIPTQVQTYTFDGQQGQQIFFDLTNPTFNFNYSLIIEGPNGESVLDSQLREQSTLAELPATGQYTITIGSTGDNLLDLAFTLFDSSTLTTPVQLNERVFGATNPLQNLIYQFDATAGQNVVFDVGGNPGATNRFEIRDPNGDIIGDGFSTRDQVLGVLALTGTYSITIEPFLQVGGGRDHDARGEFDFRVQEVPTPGTGGLLDNIGTEYWVAAPPSGSSGLQTNQELTIRLTSETATSVLVDVPGIGFVSAVDVVPGEVTVVTLPQDAITSIQVEDAVDTSGIHILANDPVSVQVVQDGEFSSEGYLAHPVDSLGTDFVVLDYGGFQSFGEGNSQLLVVAAEDNTQVTITPTLDLTNHVANVPYTVTLNQGDVYRVSVRPGIDTPANSFTGTSVSSDLPISVFGGSTASFIPERTSAADMLVEQLPATSTWGQEFRTLPFAERTGGDTFRFVAAQDNTEVFVNGTSVATLDRGEFHTMLIDEPAVILGSNPILVGQFANSSNFDGNPGDPSFLIIDPQEQNRNDYTFATGITGIDVEYVNVVIRQADLPSLRLNGQPVDEAAFVTIDTDGSTTWVGAQILVVSGDYQLTADNPFSATVYGFGTFDSYAYSAGTGLARVANVAGLELTPDAITLAPGQTHTVVASVVDTDGNPIPDIRVDFTVVGVNPEDGFAYSDEFGNASFTWTGDNGGSDAVAAVVGNLVGTASVNWQVVQPIVTISTPDAGNTFGDGQTVVLSGLAIAGAPEAPIATVTVNGTTVDSLDAAGNWFAAVSLANGATTFDVEATDVFGNTASATVELFAAVGSPDFAQFSQLDSNVAEIVYTGTSFNRSTGHLCFEYTLTNHGESTIQDGAQIAFGEFSPAAVSVANGQIGTDQLIGQQEYFLQGLDIPAGGLLPGESTSNVGEGLVFSNLSRQRFDFEAFVVVADNSAPEFESSPTTIAVAGQTYSYQAVATDIDGDQLVYSLLSAPEGVTIDSQTGDITWTPGADDIGNHSISIEADDQQGGTASQTFILTAAPAGPTNRAPVFVSQPVTQFNLGTDPGATGTWTSPTTVIDPDGDAVTLEIADGPSGLTIDSTTGLLQWDVGADDVGTVSVSIRATDAAGNESLQTFDLEILNVAAAEISGTVFEDINGDGIQQAGESGLAGRTVYLDNNGNGQADANEQIQTTDANGAFAFTGLLAGTYAVGQVLQTGFEVNSPVGAQQSLQVAVGQSVSGVDFANQITGITGQSAPVISSEPPLFAKVGDLYQYQIVASDADGDTLGFTILDGPEGAVVDPDTGLLQWTPTADQQERTSIVLLVDDGNGNSVSQSFDLLVRPEFEAPYFTSTPDRFVDIDAAFTYDADAVDPEMEDVLFDLVSGPEGATIDPATGVIQWTPDSTGAETFTLSATDESGQIAFQTFPVDVRAANTAPVFTSTPITEATFGSNYSYTAVAEDAEDTVTYSLTSPVDGVRINSQTGIVTILQIDAAKDFTIRATDERGGFAEQEVSVAVVADTQAPSASIFVDADLTDGTTPVVQLGETVSVFITVTDNVSVASFDVTVDGQAVTLDNLNRFFYTAPSESGAPVIEVTATDTSGNVSVTQQRIRVFDPTDVTAPEIEINSPGINSQVTYLTDVAITVTGDDLFDWVLEYSLKDTGTWTQLASGIDEVNGEVVATFDPTLLQNDQYDIRVTATDVSGNIATETIFVSVEGQAKLGNYALEFTDLVVPLAGIPINITRQYDTLNANESGDFGYGWKLSIGQADIRETIAVSESELSGVPALFGGADAFFAGTRVYVTTPEGQRVGFTFTPEAIPGLLGTRFTPKFTADVDTNYELEVPNIPLGQNADGTFGLFLFGGNYNPREYTLVSTDQISYTYDQFDGLQTVTNRNGVTLEYREDGIFSSTGESIDFVRDDQGRITQIIDPSGAELNYAYSASGDLSSFTDQVDNTVTYEYSDERAHFLDRITGPRGNLINEVQYDDDGRFVAIIDALGDRITQEYDTPNNVFYQTDGVGNRSELSFDNRGNITRQVDGDGNVTLASYDDPENVHLETSVTDPNGNTTRLEYDSRGNVTLIEEAGGLFTRVEYDSFNNITRTIGPATEDPGDGFADTLLDSFFTDGESLGTTIGDRLNELPFGAIDSADIILGPEFDRNTETVRDADYLSLANAGDYVTVGFDEVVVDRAGDDIFVITPFFGANFAQTGNMAEVSVTTDGVNFVTVGQVGLEPYAGVDLADAGITAPVTGVRVTAIDTADGDDTNNEFLIVGIQVTTGDFNSTRSIYDENGNLTSFTNAEGETEFFVNDAFGRPTTITDPRGNGLQLTYSNFSDPDIITFADGSSRTTVRDERGLLESITNETGAATVFSRDAAGRPLSITDALGNVYENIYEDDLLVRTIDPLGRETLFEYDDKNRLTTITDAIGGETTRTYDANDRVLSVTNQLGQTQSWTYSPINEVTSFTDGAGETTLFTYDAFSNLLSVEDARGSITSFEYDERNRLTSETDALGNIESYVFDERDNLISVTERSGATSQFEYDNVNRLLSVTDAIGGLQRWVYDDGGNTVAFIDELDNETTFEYDVRDRLVRQVDAAGFDQLSAYDDANRLIQFTDQGGFDTFFEYDGNNRLVSQTDSLGGIVGFAYDTVGNRTATTDELGRVTSSTYDDLNRVVSLLDASGALTQFSYDGLGNLTSLIDQLGNETAYQYDLRNQLLVETDPLGNESVFTYDAVGNLSTSTDRLGRVTEFNYDALNQLTDEVWLAVDGTQVNNFVYFYDANSNLLSAGGTDAGYAFTYDLLDRVTSVENVGIPFLPEFSLSYTYDAFGNLTRTQDNFGVTLDRSFDSRNLLESINWSGGPIDDARLEYSYDGRGFNTGIERFSDLSGTNLISETTQAFDALGRVTTISHLNGTGSVIADYNFSFDAASQLVQQTIDGDSIDYTFDDLGQLLTSDSTVIPNESFTYDDAGNRLQGNNVIGPNNQLLSDGTFDYEYDAEGNLVRRTAIATGEYTSYEFDHRNRMVSATRFSSGGIIESESEFEYNVFDELIRRSVDADGAGPQEAETFVTVYENGNAWADFDESGNLITQYLFGDGLDSNIARFRVGEGTAWYLTDQLGSVRDIVDASGNLINHIEYDSYGNVLVETNAAAGDRFKFTGREFQSELGFYYYRARFYDPASGRFVSQDPIGFDGGDQNLYGYVGNQSLTFTDPTGNAATASRATVSSGISASFFQATFTECFIISLATNVFVGAGLDALTPGTPSPTAQAIGLTGDAIFAAVSCLVFPPAQVATAGFAVVAVALTVARPVALSASASAIAHLSLNGSLVTAFAQIGDGGGDQSGDGDSDKGEFPEESQLRFEIDDIQRANNGLRDFLDRLNKQRDDLQGAGLPDQLREVERQIQQAEERIQFGLDRIDEILRNLGF